MKEIIFYVGVIAVAFLIGYIVKKLIDNLD